jgi:hypothetical protein
MQRGDHPLRIANRDPPLYTANDEIGSPPLLMILGLTPLLAATDPGRPC